MLWLWQECSLKDGLDSRLGAGGGNNRDPERGNVKGSDKRCWVCCKFDYMPPDCPLSE